MENLKDGGLTTLASDSIVLPRPKPVTSSTLQQAKESAIASKDRLRNTKASDSALEGKLNIGSVAHTTRSGLLTESERHALRESKQKIADFVKQEFVSKQST